MRHASQLCRGLAEVARSIERPYVPRHVPLPSSSYSAPAQTSSTSYAPGHSTSGPSSSRDTAPQLNDGHVWDSEAVNSSLLPSTKSHSPSTASTHRNEVPQSAVVHIERRNRDATPNTEAAPPIESVKSQSALRHTGRLAQNACKRSKAGSRLIVDASSKSAPGSSTTHSSTSDEPPPTQLSMVRSMLGHKGAKSDLESVMATYPHLNEPQAGLLVRTIYQINSLRSHAPSALMAWYEDLVWTAERQSQNSQRSESLESLSMLLRYAYQRNDLRSLLRMKRRATRFPSIAKQSLVKSHATDSMSTRMRGPEVDGIHLWPGPNENPILLAHNLKIAFAAREGNWVKVEELLNDAGAARQNFSEAVRVGHGSSLMARSGYALNAIGWGSLLRFGLGNVQKLKSRNAGEIRGTGQALQGTNKIDTVSNISTSDVLLQNEISKAVDDEAQMQAKLSVTKRLLPDLLCYTNGSSRRVRSECTSATGPAKDSTAKFGGGTTPAWLLQAVLTQLAERGETVSTIKIVQLALSEDSSTVKRDSTRDARPTHILNLVLMACHRNHKVNLAETLRIFNSLTGSRLGESISGSAVIPEPTVVERGQDQRSPPSKSLQKEERKADTTRRPAAGQYRMMPNEESLVLILKKVRHPLFRASWTRKLVGEFEQSFPKAKLSGRSYRMIIDKCVTPAPASQSSKADSIANPEIDSTRVAAERLVASGRRGRRLRQKAAASRSLPSTTISSIQTTSHSAGPLRTARPPSVKQSILSTTLDEVLHRFAATRAPPTRLHLSTTNRRRFEHTLLRAKRILLQKKDSHLQKLPSSTPTPDILSAQTLHHTTAISQIDTLLDKIAQVQRLGRRQEARSKQARTQANV